MEIPCKQISPHVKACLQDPGRFQLLSKFEQVLNLWDGKNVLSLQTGQIPLTPLSLVLQQEGFRAAASALDRDWGCSADGGLLRGEGWVIDAREAEVFRCGFPERGGQYPEEALRCVEKAARVLAKPDSLCRLVIPPQDALQSPYFDTVQTSAQQLLEQGHPEELVGLGGGLTPAGDDFLVGCLAFLHRYGPERDLEVLWDALYEKRRRTTALSQAFLVRATEGEFSAPVLALFAAVEKGAQEDIMACTARLCAVGHTSGSDLLGGILYAAKRFGANEEKGEIT